MLGGHRALSLYYSLCEKVLRCLMIFLLIMFMNNTTWWSLILVILFMGGCPWKGSVCCLLLLPLCFCLFMLYSLWLQGSPGHYNQSSHHNSSNVDRMKSSHHGSGSHTTSGPPPLVNMVAKSSSSSQSMYKMWNTVFCLGRVPILQNVKYHIVRSWNLVFLNYTSFLALIGYK